ncbi:MAG: hypothetical protein PUC00_04425 [Clostridiales bacterium]|nr:hypothetical protein [Clostridiales bacterium]
MDFKRSLIFAYLEEDNTQRAYFRVRPLLSLEGDLRQEALQLWPNEGGLRIVPDCNEKRTFKARMRKLMSYCVLDLRNQPEDADKIRTNKNFKPERGEVNQYILYSDTVKALPEHTFYQLMEGDAARYQELAAEAITPLFFIQQGETLFGPVRKDAPAQPEPAAEAACVLFELPCPDGVERKILCMEDAPAVEAPAAQEQPEAAPAKPEKKAKKAEQVAKDEELPIGQALTILDERETHEETLRQLDQPVSEHANLLRQKEKHTLDASLLKQSGPLSGTPLVRKPLHVAAQQPKNRIQEVVSSQWSVGKYEPPAQNLPTGTAMRTVENPVEAACAALREAWKAENAREQLLDFMLSLEGVRTPLEAKLCHGESVTAMQQVLRQRLQDLEAERLTALCELDRARRDLDAYKQELLNAMSTRIARETGKLEADRQDAAVQVEGLKTQINALTLQRDALLAKVNELGSSALPEAVARITAEAQMCLPVPGVPLRLHPVSGHDADLDEMIARVTTVCSDAGITIDRNTAIALLVLLAVSPRIGVTSATPAAAATLLRNLHCAMGWQSSYAHQYDAEQHPLLGLRPVDATPAILSTSLPHYAHVDGMTKLLLHRNASGLTRNAAYDTCQWPIVMLPSLPYVAERADDDATPISAASIAKVAEKEYVSDAELDAVLSPVLNAASPLSGAARKEMYRFVSVCAGLMEGGLPAAMDWGILLWIIPALEKGAKNTEHVKARLDEYPLSLSKL